MRAAYLGSLRVRRAVGAEEEARVAAGGGGRHGAPVLLPLQDGQAERVRPQTTLRSGASTVLSI